MGLFSGSTETVYASYASLLYQGMKPVAQQSVTSSVAYNRNIATDLIANVSNGILFKANQFYRYAKGGKYHWGLPEGQSLTVPPYIRDSAQIVLETVLGQPVLMTAVHVAPDDKGDYVYTIDYFLINEQGEVGVEAHQWTYNEGTEEYPTLTLDKVEQVSPYYPIIPIRMNNVNLAERVEVEEGEEPVEEYEYAADIRAGCRYLDIDLDNLYDGINGQLETDGDNPPEEMYVVMGVSISANTKRTNEYLFRYFEQLYGEAVVKEEDYLYWEANKGGESPPVNTVLIKDAQYHAELSYDYIKQSITDGSENPVGTYSVAYEKNTGKSTYKGHTYSTSGIRVTKQINKTQVLEYVVRGAVYRTLVASKKWVATDLEGAFEDPDGAEDGQNFIIPLRKDVCKKMGNIKSHDLMYESIRLVTCDEHVYKLKWYQSGFFQVFLIIIAFVISWAFPPAGYAAWTAAAAGVAAVNIAIGMILLPIITAALNEVVGEEFALLIAVIAVMYGANVTGIDGNVLNGLVSVSAPTITSVVSAIAKGYTGLKTIQIKDDLEEIAEENEALDTALEDLYDEEMQSAYDTNRTVNMVTSDPYNIMGASGYVTESRMTFKKENYIVDTTDKFVALAQVTDRPDSYIRLNVY